MFFKYLSGRFLPDLSFLKQRDRDTYDSCCVRQPVRCRDNYIFCGNLGVFVNRVCYPEHLQIGDERSSNFSPKVFFCKPSEDVAADKAEQENADRAA